MKQIYIEYTKWEDYQNGMYDTYIRIDKNYKIELCVNLLTNTEEFYNVCVSVCEHWKNATDVNLSNLLQNRNAWLGAVACCYKYNAPECLTRSAWGKLTNLEQYRANNVANKIIKLYERKHNKLYRYVGEKMLF